jgi:transcriptional regulator GlxA family with amidase domain
MEIALLVFDGLTALDAIGPFEVLSRLPGAEVRLTAKERGPISTGRGNLRLIAEHDLSEITAPDILVVPGGGGTRALMSDEELLDWIRSVHRHTRWTTSVCTGALLLGAAGLLDGLRATTHWLEMDTIASQGAEPTGERVVREGKIITAAGVSSGIDMALTLVALEAGDEVAQAIQLSIEYDPQPPFDAGSPEKAPPEIVARLRGLAAAPRG